MTLQKHLAEYRPELRFVIDERPPLATKIYMVSVFGNGFIGDWRPEYQIVAWAYLPKYSKEQKEREEQYKLNGWKTPDGRSVTGMDERP